MPKGKPLLEETKRKISLTLKNRFFSIDTRRKISLALIGRSLSEEARRKMSLVRKGKHRSEETKRKISTALKGRKFSEETKRKISLTHKGMGHSEETKKKMALLRIGKHHSEETKRKMSEAHKGKSPRGVGFKHSKETKRKMSEAHKGKKLPIKHIEKIRLHMKGYKFSEEAKRKMSLSHIGLQAGKKHPNWQGGKSFEPYPLGWTNTFKEQIRYRDGYKCQLCGVPEVECTRKLHVHHIDYDKQNVDPNNLISLCLSCHIKTNRNREYWTIFFKKVNIYQKRIEYDLTEIH